MINRNNIQNITIIDGNKKTRIPFEEILFVQAEHVYIRIHLVNQKQLLHRISLQCFMSKLNTDNFLQIHRSYIINTRFIKRWDNDRAYLPGYEVPISRSRRKVIDKLMLSA